MREALRGPEESTAFVRRASAQTRSLCLFWATLPPGSLLRARDHLLAAATGAARDARRGTGGHEQSARNSGVDGQGALSGRRRLVDSTRGPQVARTRGGRAAADKGSARIEASPILTEIA